MVHLYAFVYSNKEKKRFLFFSCLMYLCLCIYSFVDVLHYIHLQDRQLMYFYTFVIQKKKKKKTARGNMGKNIKSYATIPTLHSLGKGRKPYGKKSQSIGQTKHDSGHTHFLIPRLLKLHVKIPNFFSILIYSESCRFHAIHYKIHPP